MQMKIILLLVFHGVSTISWLKTDSRSSDLTIATTNLENTSVDKLRDFRSAFYESAHEERDANYSRNFLRVKREDPPGDDPAGKTPGVTSDNDPAGKTPGVTSDNDPAGKTPGVTSSNDPPGPKTGGKNGQDSNLPWIGGNITIPVHQKMLMMHAFIVKEEDVPDCGVAAEAITKRRYFMCSGAILNDKHVLTSASCINRAAIDGYLIDADIAVLVGALGKISYVIKIKDYKIHPLFAPNQDLVNHPKNNIAVLMLSCPIPSTAAIMPKLPSQQFDDVGHLCCPNRCPIFTVVRNLKNEHTVELMKAKHLPLPVHHNTRFKKRSIPADSLDSFIDLKDFQNEEFPIQNFTHRKIRETKKNEILINKLCPPLGTPVIANNDTLVGLVVYTCDDDQDWVEWKYTEVIRNIDWIRKEMNKK